MWIIPKKTDASGKKKVRVVIDYRKLNEKTVDDKYPIPQIEEILDNLGKSAYFTTLDLKSGFHQIEMNSKDIEKNSIFNRTRTFRVHANALRPEERARYFPASDAQHISRLHWNYMLRLS